jgi:hypothetical protein
MLRWAIGLGAIAALALLAARIDRVEVAGDSMRPTLLAGDRLLVLRTRRVQPGWVVVVAAPDGRPLWLGSASFDRGVGFSHDTGQITHHIGPDLDAERGFLINSLEAAGVLASTYSERGVGPTETGRNGGGDPYFTDGMTTIGILRP